MFGFDTNASKSDQLKSLDKIEEWLREEAEEWDNSEPKVFMPKEFFNAI